MNVYLSEDFFKQLPNPRIDLQQRHGLMDSLFISVCTVVCGAKSFVDIADFGEAKEARSRVRLSLEDGTPS